MGATARDRILETLEQLPPSATIEDAMERLYFLAKVERGLREADAGQVVSHESVRSRFAS
jgi:predicted transcriptional regulator